MTSPINFTDITGIVFLNKPTGISSNKALQLVKRHFKAKKAGHVGTLDPLAAGILPICLGEATKFAHLLQASTKGYLVGAQLGFTTTTGDAEGQIITTSAVPTLSSEYLNDVLKSFLGVTTQIPPMFSAIKVNGQPLYKLARQGKVIDRAPRTITIDEINLMENLGTQFSFKVICSKGSYMRTLVEDIGKNLGCGAYMHDLTRVQLGNFKLTDCVTLDDLLAIPCDDYRYINSLNILKPLMTNLKISANQEQELRYGRQVQLTQHSLVPQVDIGLIAEDTNNLIGLGQIILGNVLITQRLISI